MNKNKLSKGFNTFLKKSAKFAISLSMALTSCIGMNPVSLSTVVHAEDNDKQAFYIEGTDDGSSFGRYLGVDGARIMGHVIKGRDDSIAYCLSRHLKFPNSANSDNPTIYSKSSDDTEDWHWYLSGNRQPTQAQVKLIQKALYAGYPTRLPKEMGFSSNNEERGAYYATQVAIWTILEGWGTRVYKLEGQTAEENAIIDEIYNAYKKIMNYVNSDKTSFSPELMITNTKDRNRISSLKLTAPSGSSYKESQELTVRPVQDAAYATDPKLGLSFSVGFEGKVPEGAKIVDSNGNECYDFGQGSKNGTVFKIRIPANTTFNGQFKVVVNGTFVRNAPLVWNTANTAYQTLMQFGAVQSSGDTDLIVTETGNASGTIIIDKVAQVPAGYDGILSDDKYPTGDGEMESLLINEIKYAYLPKEGVQFSVYYKNDGSSFFANELAARGTTDKNGRVVLSNIILDSAKPTTEFYIKETKAPVGIQLDPDKTWDLTLTKKADNTATGTLKVSNDAVKAHLTLNKRVEVLENGSSVFKNAGRGVQFGVYLNETNFGLAKDSLIKIIETDANGQLDTGNLPLNGSFYLKELKTLDGYTLDTNKYTFNTVVNTLLGNSVKPLHFTEVSNPKGETVKDITNYIKRLNLTINKEIQYVDDSGVIKTRPINEKESSLFEFSVYSDAKATKKVGDMIYDKTVGGYVLGELDYTKTYYVKETKSPEIYKANNTVLTMNAEDSTKTVLNELTSGSITITKYNKDSGDKMSGIEFVLTGTNSAGKTVITKTAKTNVNGVVKFDNLPATLKYTVKEKVPSGFKNITGDINADFTSKVSDIAEDVFNQEVVQDINIKVIKTNEIETVLLDGVKFELYKQSDLNKVIASGTTDKNGELRFSKLEKDVYVLVETETKEHYEMPTGDDAKTVIDLTKVQDEHTEVVKIKNKSIPLAIEILKVNGNKSSFSYLANIAPIIAEGEKVQGNVTFKLYKLVDGVQKFIAEGKTNAEGKLVFTDSPDIIYGETYVLKETPVNGYKPMNDLVFTIANNIKEDTVYVKAVNELFKGEINVIKTDGKTTVAMEGVEFKLYKDTTLIDTKKTDKNGKIKFDNLEAGTYTVIESQTNEGYVLDTTPQNVTLNTANPAGTVTFVNHRKHIKINILKTIGTEEAVTVKKGTTEEALKSSDVSLDGVEFSIFEGKTLIEKGKTVDGKLVFDSDKLMVGVKYTLKETGTPSGYKPIDDIEFEIALDEAAQYSVINVKVQNKLVKNVIELLKYDNKSKEPIANTEITLYRTPTGTDSSDIVAKAVTDKDGIARFEGLVNGTYYLAETKASDGYVLDENAERIEVVLDSAEFTVKRVTLGNDRKTIDINITKQDRESKDKLQNAGFALYQVKDGVENLVAEGTTDENGKLEFLGLEVGYMYKLVETRVPDGYIEPEDNFVYFEVPMNPKDTTISFVVDNDKTPETPTDPSEPIPPTDIEKPDEPEEPETPSPKYTKIQIVKIDEDDKETRLSNAEFEIRRIVLGQEVLVDKGTTDKNGEFVSKELERGYKYKIVETKQPNGYLMPEDNETIVDIDKDTDTKVISVKVTNKKIVDAVNIKIIKVDEDDNKHRLPNAEFAVYQKEDGNKISLVAKGKTDKNGELLITGLKKGQTYTILETKAPDGYKIKGLASQDITISEDENNLTIEHIRENTKVVPDKPHTGDTDRNIPLYVGIGTAVVIFVAAGGYIVYRKKKDSESDNYY